MTTDPTEGLTDEQLEQVAADALAAGDELREFTDRAGEGPMFKSGTAAQKIQQTLKQLSMPDPDASAMELTLASVAMGLENGLTGELATRQDTGEVDEFVLALTRWIALHRSDNVPQLVVVPIPRRQLPAGTRLHLLNQAMAEAEKAESPF